MLLGFEQAIGFLIAAVLITVAPGPDNLMILSLGMAKGRRDGIAFGLGCALGCLSHTALAALGVSALIAASPWAFFGLKLCGGFYLVWLGVQSLRNARPLGTPSNLDGRSSESGRRLFFKGIAANTINPKVVIFFLAFLPQFVDLARGTVGWQTAQLGVLFTLQAVAVFSVIGYFAGGVGEFLGKRPGTGTWLDRTAGAIFILLGVRLMVAR